ncbi:ABC transporter substrate-binding protein [Azospirillum sp.]|uniref:ABC transporter substrate-binding protein n=1 Tax=Azospirillum sp. TaxID=34012 RepID=UPI002D60ECD5|nr:ABC transporter substrate-binding protein [Azospirillum sp.]HYD64946.1 ABC transporter substrate-binding protein [Azospirillum sp.]
MSVRAALLSFVLIFLFALQPARAAETLRLGLLKFGTVSWEIETLRRQGLDAKAGLTLEIVDLANPEAGKIALLGGSVDVIVSDWLWTARQRADGDALSFVPYSGAVGAVMVPGDSPVRSLADLKGKRIGVAGGPLDKSWLLVRGLAKQEHGFDPAGGAEPVFAAPPLLSQQAEARQLDAVLIYWNFAARLEAKGFRRLLDVEEAGARLGGGGVLVPSLGYVFREDWARAHPRAIAAFFKATLAAKAVLAADDAAWEPLRPLMRAEDEATFRALRDGYRAGIPTRWGAEQRQAAEGIFTVLARLGGAPLVGKAERLPPGTFWPDAAIPPIQ